ncbi:MAG TPA: glycosyltransferase family 39 protein, partial [Ardenticatenaceae bacterium]|nr:glycosyltransferase family 39 protein [Ardenticatenaceae bacterium]
AEILIMTGVYSLTGQLTEELARLPFALANLTCLFVGFLLGWRLFGPVAGWITAILLALDGYYIGYGRIAQYSSLIFLAPALAVLILHRLARLPKALPGYLTLVAIVLAGGLLAHYEVALVIAPGAYLLWLLWQRVRERAALGRALVAPLLIGGVALASFYIPFLLDPNIANTFSHYSDGTFGGQLPHNNLRQFFLQTSMYNTTYYVVLMIALAVLALARIYLRGLGRVWGGLASLVLILGVLLSALVPGWLTLGGSDFTALFFGVALAGAWLIPGVGTEERLVWIWLGVTMLLAFFLIARPSSHLYDLAMPWALLNGMVLARGWRWLRERVGTRGAAAAGVSTAALTIALFGGYAYWAFVYNVDILRNWSKPSIYWTAYERPDDLPTFGFPHKSGWKAIGALYRDGVIAGTYDTNHKGWVAEWYTRGAPQCDSEFDYFFLDLMEEPEEHAEVRGELEEGGFRLAGSVGVDGQQRLEIYERTAGAPAPRDYDLAAYESRFDAQLLDPQFRLDYPTVRPRHPAGYRLGEQIWLEAYNLDRERVRPGETLELTLYWRTTGRVPERYTVFNQLIDPGVAMYGQQDREPGCDGGPTTDWHPGDLIVDRYEVPVFAEAKPGTYPLITGMYQAERGERLEVYDAAGHPLGNSIELTRITVEPPQ